MSEYKIIIAGQLEFGNQRVYTQVYEQYLHRMEHYYKDDILLKPEGYFKEEELSLVVPRTVLTGSERDWRNTLNLLERVVSFSIAGSLNMWRLDAGKMIDHHLLEPKSERTTVQIFNKGRELIEQQEEAEKASELMTKVVKRFARHGQAYERRGFINLKLGNLDDALYDYNKSLTINPAMPEAHYGRGLIYDRREQFEEAATDYEAVTKNTIPYQPLYWMAQVALGDTYLKLGRPNDALRIYNMFFKRKQRLATLERYARRVNFEYAKLLTVAGRYGEAYKGFEAALEAKEDPKAPSTQRIHYEHGKALEADGKAAEAAKQFKLAGPDFQKAVKTSEVAELSA